MSSTTVSDSKGREGKYRIKWKRIVLRYGESRCQTGKKPTEVVGEKVRPDTFAQGTRKRKRRCARSTWPITIIQSRSWPHWEVIFAPFIALREVTVRNETRKESSLGKTYISRGFSLVQVPLLRLVAQNLKQRIDECILRHS